MIRGGYDDVGGVVIGEVSNAVAYHFVCGGELFASGSFISDAAAEAYVRDYWPTRYARGVEMRCFDGTRRAAEAA